MTELKHADPDLAEILAKHNRRVKPAEFAPRLHSLKVCQPVWLSVHPL